MQKQKAKVNITDLARIRWHCRRGMLELDVLLGNFFQQSYLCLSATEQQQFIDLLDCNDDQLWSWLVKKQRPDPQFQTIVNKII